MNSRILRILEGPPDVKIQPEYRPTWKERAARHVLADIWRRYRGRDAWFDFGLWPFLMTPRLAQDFPRQWPQRIFCSHLDYNPAFKEWVADSVDHGSELHILQHGGGFGSMKDMALEDHYRGIADVFHSWGWAGENVQPGPSVHLQRMAAKIHTNPEGYIYWILTGAPKVPYRRFSFPQGDQFQEYFEDQFALAWALPPQIRAQIVLRLYPDDYGWKIREQWERRFPEIHIERHGIPIAKGLSGSRLAMVTSNTTTLLETLAAHHPAIAFLNPKHWELRDSAKPFYQQLREAQILVDSPERAAAAIQSATAEWWELSAAARRVFCREFART